MDSLLELAIRHGPSWVAQIDPEAVTAVRWLSELDGLGALAVALVALWREWIVSGPTHRRALDDMRAERDAADSERRELAQLVMRDVIPTLTTVAGVLSELDNEGRR